MQNKTHYLYREVFQSPYLPRIPLLHITSTFMGFKESGRMTGTEGGYSTTSYAWIYREQVWSDTRKSKTLPLHGGRGTGKGWETFSGATDLLGLWPGQRSPLIDWEMERDVRGQGRHRAKQNVKKPTLPARPRGASDLRRSERSPRRRSRLSGRGHCVKTPKAVRSVVLTRTFKLTPWGT